MTLCLSHETALRYWFKVAENHLKRPEPARISHLEDTPPARSELREACARYSSDGAPLHLVVSAAASKRPISGVKYSERSRDLPKGSLVRCEPGIFAFTPESLFVQLASEVSEAELIELGFILCGSYVPSMTDVRGFAACEPLTTPAKLRSYVEDSSGIKGAKKARRALDRALPNSASPRETQCAMLLSLPKRMGGYGLRPPVLNHRVDFPANYRTVGRSLFYRCDLCWPDRRVVLEYESEMFHSTVEKIAFDSMRRNALESLGYDVLTITNMEIKNEALMDVVAGALEKKLGVRRRQADDGYSLRKAELRSLLLEGRRWV